MIHVNNLYEGLVESGKVRGIVRYNLRKFCKSFGLPACGVSFWWLDDLNWDYLGQLNDELANDKFRFRGGEDFPRSFLDGHVIGQTERTEFIFLITQPRNHQQLQHFFRTCFSSAAKHFGVPFPAIDASDMRPLVQHFRNQLWGDIIHFDVHQTKLQGISEFYLGLIFACLLGIDGGGRDPLFEAFKVQFPQYRSEMTRILTTSDLFERLDDTLHLLSKVL